MIDKKKKSNSMSQFLKEIEKMWKKSNILNGFEVRFYKNTESNDLDSKDYRI